jgi:hypothetical protein
MKLPWFKRNGIFFTPTSFPGWVILGLGLAYEVYYAIDLNNRSHSVSDFLMNLVFMLLIIGAIYSLIAYLIIRVFGR